MSKLIVCALLAAGALAIAACRGSGKLISGDNTPIVGGSSFEWNFEAGSLSIDSTPGGLPPGTCIKIVWLDGAGNPIGESEATADGPPVDVPEGTEGASFSPCDPPQEPPKKIGKRSHDQAFVAGQFRLFAYRQIPLDFSDGAGRCAEYIVTARSEEEADDIARRFTAGMFQEQPDPRVETWGTADVELLADGRVRYTIFSREAPTAFAFEWNGTALFDLADAVVQTAHGWYAITVHVPGALVDSSPMGAANAARYSLVLPERTIELETSFSFEP